VKIRVVKVAPVATVFASRAMAIFPFANFSAMIPEPTTAARRKAVPRHSATTRRGRVIKEKEFLGAAAGGAASSRGLGRSKKGADELAFHLSGQRTHVEAPHRQEAASVFDAVNPRGLDTDIFKTGSGKLCHVFVGAQGSGDTTYPKLHVLLN
jgi:hypothetical protein